MLEVLVLSWRDTEEVSDGSGGLIRLLSPQCTQICRFLTDVEQNGWNISRPRVCNGNRRFLLKHSDLLLLPSY